MELDLWQYPGGHWKNFAYESDVEYCEEQDIESIWGQNLAKLRNGKNKDFRI